mgnify:CR=1 FL=1
MYLWGIVGTGKTHILRSIKTAFGSMALYISAGDFEQKMHERRQNDTLGNFYQVFVSAPILLLDDLGMEYGGELLKTGIEKIIDLRYERWRDKPTIVASNKSPLGFEKYLSRAADRVMDKERSTTLYISGDKSFRELAIEERK